MVEAPHVLVEARGRVRLHALYYITKQIIPALERCFSLVGADLRAWFAALPRPQRLLPQKRAATLAAGAGPGARGAAAGTIDRYYLSRHCAV
jgi:DNA polymerase zeta